MSDSFETCHSFVFRHEGVLSDDPTDKGGITKYGVCIVFLRGMARRRPRLLAALGIPTDVTRSVVKAITAEQARELFRAEFWEPYRLDELPTAVAACVYDFNVNSGAVNSVRIIQKACNLHLGTSLVRDGILGPLTRSAAARMASKQGIAVICGERRAFYRRIAEHDETQRCFLNGWMNRANDLQDFAERLL